MNKSQKIVFAGCSNVGKTSIIHKLHHNDLINTGPTIGAGFFSKNVILDGKSIILDIWDTAGQERYYAMSAHYFRGATHCVLVFDIGDRHSFENVDIWKRLCDDANSRFEDRIPVYILIGNKIDNIKRDIPNCVIKDYCKFNNIYEYVETSALTGEGLKAFINIIIHDANRNINSLDTKVNNIIVQPPRTIDNTSVVLNTNNGCKC